MKKTILVSIADIFPSALFQFSGLLLGLMGAFFLAKGALFKEPETIAKKSALYFYNYDVAKDECSNFINTTIGFDLLVKGFFLQFIAFMIKNPLENQTLYKATGAAILLFIFYLRHAKLTSRSATHVVGRHYYKKTGLEDFERATGESLDFIGKCCGVKRNRIEPDEKYRERIRKFLK